MFSVFINTDRNKRGQTSRLVARAKIETSCIFEWNEVVYLQHRYTLPSFC